MRELSSATSAGSPACAPGCTAGTPLSLRLLSLKSGNANSIPDLIETRLLLRLHCRDVQNGD
jgi:hypothetical protein